MQHEEFTKDTLVGVNLSKLNQNLIQKYLIQMIGFGLLPLRDHRVIFQPHWAALKYASRPCRELLSCGCANKDARQQLAHARRMFVIVQETVIRADKRVDNNT